MPEAALRPLSLPHAVFLERASLHPPTSAAVRQGQGAFLVLRLLDLLGPNPPVAVTEDAFRYQWAATDRYCRELNVGEAETTHLQGLVRAGQDAHSADDVRVLAPGLLAYAHYLEDEGHYDEAADVVQTTITVGGERLGAADRIAAQLRLGRVRRKVMRWEEAEAAYAVAGEVALAVGDAFSALLSRLGHVNVLHFRGNLAEAESQYRGILADAQAGGHREAEARSQHGLGVVLTVRGQPAEAVPHLWQGHELYQDDASRLRVLQDLGLALLSLGEVQAAERALLQVVRRDTTPDSTNNALIELMHCASYRRDRLAFERWRERCETAVESMAPNMRADLLLKMGIGLARFGLFAKAERLMEEGLAVAREHQLHGLEFRIERIKSGLRDCEAEINAGQAVTEPEWSSEAVKEVSASLAALAG
jgi:tetratricopeptide (TPR) repeat protein